MRERCSRVLRVALAFALASSLCSRNVLSSAHEEGGEQKTALLPQKALVAPSRLDTTLGVRSSDIEITFVPHNEVIVHFTISALGQGDLRSEDLETLVQVVEKGHLSVVQPAESKLVVGQRSNFHKVTISKSLNVKVVPVAEGLSFEPRDLVFSRSSKNLVREFRVIVPSELPRRLVSLQAVRPSGFKYTIPVNLVLECPEGDDPCDVDHLHEPAEFLWEVLDANKLVVKETIFGTAGSLDLPISFKYPQDGVVEVYASGLVLNRHVVQISAKDGGPNTEIKVLGQRDNRICKASAPCLYDIQYVVKDVRGRLSTNFDGKTVTTSVHIFDKVEVKMPANSTAFIHQPLDLSIDLDSAQADLLQHMDAGGTDAALFEIHIQAPADVLVEPRTLSFSRLTSAHQRFRVTPKKEGKFELQFSVEGPLKDLVQLKDWPVLSISTFESFYSEDFSFEEKYGIEGLDEELNTILRRAFLSRLAAPETIEALGVSHVKGILLHGPPGCGKTTVARQIGKMLQTKGEPKVVNGPEIISKYLGESESKVRVLFADAEADKDKRQLHLIVFDEIDALVKVRGRGQGEAADQVYDGTVNTILSKMDGIDRLENVLVVGTTNRKDLIDQALLRPGRFDVIVEINLPTQEGRLQILRIHTKSMFESNLIGDNVDLEKVSKLTKAFTGAELEGLVKTAASLAVEDAFKSADAAKGIDHEKFTVSMRHFMSALREIEPANLDSKVALDKLDGTGHLVEFSTEMKDAMEKFRKSLDYVLDGKGERGQGKGRAIFPSKNSQIKVLVHGDQGTGKTSFVANILKDYKIPGKLEVLSAAILLRDTRGSGERKIQMIHDAFRLCSSATKASGVLVLDDLDGILEIVDLKDAGSYVNSPIVSHLRTLMRSKIEGSLVLVATASTSIMMFQQLVDLFDVSLALPKVASRAQVERVVGSIESKALSAEADALIVPALEDHLPMGIKRVIKMIELGREDLDLLPEVGDSVAMGREDTRDGAQNPGMIDVLANNSTNIKIFMM